MEKKNKNKNTDKSTFNKILKKKNLILGALALVIALVIYFALGGGGPMSGNLATTSQIDENSYNQSKIMRVDLNKITSIDFDLANADVRIQKSSTNPYIEYTVLYKGEDHVYDMDVSFNEGALKLKSKVTGKDLYMKDKMPIVRIFLPKDASLDKIKGRVATGDIKITDLAAKNLDLNVKSGSVLLDNSIFKGSILTEAGSIELTRSEISETKLASNTGNISLIESKLGDKIDLSTNTGDILVETIDSSVEDYRVSAKINLGKLVLGNISYKNIKDGYQSENQGKYDLSMRTKIGDIIFNKGEGAILDQDEYITNQSTPTNEEDSEDEENLDEDKDDRKEDPEDKDKEDEDIEDSEDFYEDYDIDNDDGLGDDTIDEAYQEEDTDNY